jgi:hypothetical protein
MKRTQKAERLTHIQRWQASGLSRPDYSRKHGLKYSTFLSWFKQEEPSSEPGKFVVLPQSSPTLSPITISFPNGIRLAYEGELDQALIQYLRDA